MTLHRILSRARLLLALLSFTALAGGDPARADDSVPTEWQRLSRVEPLLTAPEPDNPVAVCVIDSGVNLTPDLQPVVISRTAYDGGDPGDTYPQPNGMTGHGTYVASFIAGQVNGWGSSGTWPRARIVSVRVFPPGGEVADLADVLRALKICMQHSTVHVINLSLGAVEATEQEWVELEARIAELRTTRNINVVAAAGNAGGAVERPARFEA
ncbi:MAG TPA: S8/S53 family peptidase, partial [Solirubrobacteraceae bacterium]|nr:S8/S53 family peptidase [Solirubrobacteraceae bacterium]